MKVGNDYKIESDALNVLLMKRYVVKENTSGRGRQPKQENIGAERWEIVGYYATPATALKGLVDREINATGLKDLRIVVAKIEELKATITSAMASGNVPINKVASVASDVTIPPKQTKKGSKEMKVGVNG